MAKNIIIVDINNPVEFERKNQLVILTDTSKSILFKRFNTYVKALINIKFTFLANNEKTSGEELAMVNYYKYLSEWYYIYNMYIDTERYTYKDIAEYKESEDNSDIVFEYESIINFFYLTLGKKVPDSILENHKDYPLYLLQRLYKKYINPSYNLIKEVDAYSEFITIII